MKQPTGQFLTTVGQPFMLPMMLFMIPIAIVYAICFAFWFTGRVVWLVAVELRRQLRSRRTRTYRVTRTYRRYTS